MSEALRVLMVGHFARRKGENDGGVSAVMSYLADALLERQDIELIGVRLGSASGDASSDDNLGFPVHSIAMKSRGLASGFRYQRQCFEEIVNVTNPDIVHGQGADLAGFLASRSGRPAIVTVHGIIGEDARYKSRFVDRIRERVTSRFIERSVIRHSESLILISPYVAAYYGEAIRGARHDIPNPVGPQYFDIEPRREEGRVLYAGRVIPRKGIVDLVSAFARIERALKPHLTIAGSLADKTYVDNVIRVIAELGVSDRVEFVGMLHDQELLKEFAKAQVLVLPSYQETAPMVILQAMAAGIPVVATRICGVPFQVSDGESGFMFTPGDISALHGHLELLLSNVELANRMGAAGNRIAVEKFHSSAVAAATVCAYQSTISNHVRL